MSFIKKYWYLIAVTIITVGLGVVAYLTSTKLDTTSSVAPNVPQVTPKAVSNDCKVAFTIATNTPTGTITSTPTGTITNTPTGTLTSTPTPTTQGNTTPECIDLTLNPTSGTAPLSLTLKCTGKDTDGDITAVEFTPPDGTTKLVEQNVGSPGSLTTTYTVPQDGSYNFSCRVRDNNQKFSDVSDACKKSLHLNIEVTPTPRPFGPTSTPSPIPTPKIPVSGTTSVLGASVVAGGFLLLLLGLVF